MIFASLLRIRRCRRIDLGLASDIIISYPRYLLSFYPCWTGTETWSLNTYASFTFNALATIFMVPNT